MVKAVIFDMDGVLINSEPFWRLAQVKALCDVGFPMTIEKAIETQGFRIDEVITYRYQQQPWQGASIEHVTQAVIDEVIRLVETQGVAMEGVEEVFSLVQSLNVKVGLASSSSMRVIKSVIKTLSLEKHFDILASAEGESHGKPHPAVYLSACKALDVLPFHCAAIEDSVTGMIAAASAKMHTIVIPEKGQFDDKRFGLADVKAESLLALKAHHFTSHK